MQTLTSGGRLKPTRVEDRHGCVIIYPLHNNDPCSFLLTFVGKIGPWKFISQGDHQT